MENSYETSNGNGQMIKRHSLYHPSFEVSLAWLDLRVFYVRVSKCEIDDSTPEYLTINLIPLNPNTLLEVNGVRNDIYSNGISTLLRRDRLCKKTEEATFVSTDSIRVTASVKFEVFDRDTLLLSGALDLCDGNGFIGGPANHGQRWSMTCEANGTTGTGFFKEKHHMIPESASPKIEVYVAGSFSDSPIILTKALNLGFQKKQKRMGMLGAIPEYETTVHQKDIPPMQIAGYGNHKPEDDEYDGMYPRMGYAEGEDDELSWFNAGVRVGVGIGLSLCVGLGLGVGLLVRTYQGTTSNLRRRLS